MFNIDWVYSKKIQTAKEVFAREMVKKQDEIIGLKKEIEDLTFVITHYSAQSSLDKKEITRLNEALVKAVSKIVTLDYKIQKIYQNKNLVGEAGR